MFKSMLCTLASSGRLEAPRRYRFSERFSDDIGTLVETITKDIVTRQARDGRAVPMVSHQVIREIVTGRRARVGPRVDYWEGEG